MTSLSLWVCLSLSCCQGSKDLHLSLWVSLSLSCPHGSNDLFLSSGLPVVLSPSGVQRTSCLVGSSPCPQGPNYLPVSSVLPLALLPLEVQRSPSVLGSLSRSLALRGTNDLPVFSGLPLVLLPSEVQRPPCLLGSPSRSLALRGPLISLSLRVSLSISCHHWSKDFPLPSALPLALLTSLVQRSPCLLWSSSRRLALRCLTISLCLCPPTSTPFPFLLSCRRGSYDLYFSLGRRPLPCRRGSKV